MCTRCVMDTTAEEISFDSSGICSFCHSFDENVKPVLDRAGSTEGRRLLNRIVASIKNSAHGKPYDSILGISGGTDSSYLAYLASELGLRPLLVNVDTGWDTPESKSNVENLVSKLGFDLEIITVDWDEMRDLQLAFYRSSVKNCEIPQDHAFLAALYKKAAQEDVRYILTGGNLATESVLPRSWGYNAGDLRHLLAIHSRFGTRPLRKFPTLSFWRRYLYYPFVRSIREVRLLNYVPYNKNKAKRILAEKFGWQDYGAKHYESVLTRFFQGYYLPTKFGIDKRKAHLSSLILSGQITREQALEELKKPPYPNEELLQKDKTYIAERLGLSLSEWEEILALPPRQHEDFPSSKLLFAFKDGLVKATGIRRRRYRL
ncbi:MAG: N-acetyl sugar amidotransferase [Methanothrix sp.]|uniref:N-acetyl sugar amidotransferase n=1 Tax=Methanothrix sp. TaxID=90426 RepID=UPI0032AF4C3B|nr:N-acetyl sugar amidotransferase [Methanothrix sp.]